MGKYALKKEKRPRDLWGTVDPDATKVLFPHIPKGATFAEPCCGHGDLLYDLESHLTSRWASDLEPYDTWNAVRQDALTLTADDLVCDYIITNPPYTWQYLEPLVEHFITLKPTWLLLPADFMHNKRSGSLMKRCSKVVSIGRLYWVLDEGVKPIKGKDNYCWYYWRKGGDTDYPTEFIGR